MPEPKSYTNGDKERIHLRQIDTATTTSDNRSCDDVKKAQGLTVWKAALLLLGETAGAGIVALPYAVDKLGYIGIFLLVIICVVSAYTGYLLGQCLTIVQTRYEEYRGHLRRPYPTIAYITFGTPGRIAIEWCCNFGIFNVGVVFLLMVSENTQSLLENIFQVWMPSSYILLIVSATILPLTWIGTPKNFWMIGVVAALSTTLAVILITVAIGMDATGPNKRRDIVHSSPELFPFFRAIGSMLFIFCGHPIFPTIQNDMLDQKRFPYAIALTFTGMILMMMPVTVGGYLVYGQSVSENLLLTITPGHLTYVIQSMITLHVICGFVIVYNPLLQHLEEMVRLNRDSKWKRTALRTVVYSLAVLVAFFVPGFGFVLSLTGGTVDAVLMYLAPCLFYFKLSKMEGDWDKIAISLHHKVILIEVICVTTVAAIIATIGNVISVL